jgi:hypothetical protein
LTADPDAPFRADYWSTINGSADRDWRELDPGGLADQRARVWKDAVEALESEARASWEPKQDDHDRSE